MPAKGRGSLRGRGRGRGRGRAREVKESSPDKCSDRSFSPVREDIAAVTEPPKKMKCDFCKRTNHVTESCRDLKRAKEKKTDKCNDCGYTNHSTVVSGCYIMYLGQILIITYDPLVMFLT